MKIWFKAPNAKGNQLFNNLIPKNKFPNDIDLLLVLTSHQRKITLTLHCTIMNTALSYTCTKTFVSIYFNFAQIRNIIFKENPNNMHNNPWWPFLLVDSLTNMIFDEDHPRTMSKFGFNPSRASGEDFQRIWIYHQDKVLVHIMDVGQGHHAQFWKEMIHPNIIILNLFQFGPVVLEKKKKSGKLADDSGQLTWL